MKTLIAFQVVDKDNVAVVMEEGVSEGDALTVHGRSGGGTKITATEAIPFGHKIALSGIAKGEDIVKYGEVIGRATQDIPLGSYVHVHNMESLRGRGDLEG